MPLAKHAEQLEALYKRYNRRQYVHPDPLEFLYRYADPLDREVVGLIAALLAYGRVEQILKSVGSALERLGPNPSQTLRDARCAEMEKSFAGLRHRFQGATELVALLMGMRRVIETHGSLGGCFRAAVSPRDDTVLPALCAFVRELNVAAKERCGHLLPDPAKGSACKRLNLYLRWMVRHDEVDPGGWEFLPPAKLIVPLDTHMHRIVLTLAAGAPLGGKTANLRRALEVTAAFGRVCPDDPVRYDFALTRLGIRRDTDPDAFFALCGEGVE